jgi:hypothetical protein
MLFAHLQTRAFTDEERLRSFVLDTFDRNGLYWDIKQKYICCRRWFLDDANNLVDSHVYHPLLIYNSTCDLPHFLQFIASDDTAHLKNALNTVGFTRRNQEALAKQTHMPFTVMASDALMARRLVHVARPPSAKHSVDKCAHAPGQKLVITVVTQLMMDPTLPRLEMAVDLPMQLAFSNGILTLMDRDEDGEIIKVGMPRFMTYDELEHHRGVSAVVPFHLVTEKKIPGLVLACPWEEYQHAVQCQRLDVWQDYHVKSWAAQTLADQIVLEEAEVEPLAQWSEEAHTVLMEMMQPTWNGMSLKQRHAFLTKHDPHHITPLITTAHEVEESRNVIAGMAAQPIMREEDAWAIRVAQKQALDASEALENMESFAMYRDVFQHQRFDKEVQHWFAASLLAVGLFRRFTKWTVFFNLTGESGAAKSAVVDSFMLLVPDHLIQLVTFPVEDNWALSELATHPDAMVIYTAEHDQTATKLAPPRHADHY